MNDMREPRAVFTNLRPGSVALMVGDSDLFGTIGVPPADVSLFHYTSKKVHSSATHLTFPADATAPDTLHPLFEAAVGVVPKTSAIHFQIDLLLVGSCGDQLLPLLIPYLHPGAQIASEMALADLGNAECLNGWFVYRPMREKWDVPFAKMSAEEKKWIAQNVANIPARGSYLEIGSYKGGSAVVAALANSNITIFCLDPWAAYSDKDRTAISADYTVFLRHTQFFPNIVPIRIDIEKPEEGPQLVAKSMGVPLEEMTIDMLFIDGDHSLKGVFTDLCIYPPYTSGLISGHDYKHIAEVRKAVDMFYTDSKFKRAFMALCPLRLWHTRLQSIFRPTHVALVAEKRNSIWYLYGAAADNQGNQ